MDAGSSSQWALQDMTGSPRRDSLLLSLFPWNANVITTNDLSKVFPPTHPFHRFVSNLHDWEKTLSSPHSRPIFDLQQALLMKRTRTQGRGLPTIKMSVPLSGSISNLVMMYRLVEVLAIADGNTNRDIVPQHVRVSGLNNPTYKYWSKLENWPELVLGFQNALTNVSDSHGLRTNIPNSEPLSGLLKKLTTLFKMKDGIRVLINFTLAAMHLIYLLKNDFYGAMPDLPTLTHVGTNELQTTDTFSRDDLNVLKSLIGEQEGQGLRLPLLFASLISPLMLMIPVQLHKSSFERHSLLQTSKALGNQKPRTLLAVESMIWNALIRVVWGIDDPLSALESLTSQIPWSEIDACEDYERFWFRSEASNISISLSDNYFVGDINDEWPLASDILEPVENLRHPSPTEETEGAVEDLGQPNPPSTNRNLNKDVGISSPRQSRRIAEVKAKKKSQMDDEQNKPVKKKQGKRKQDDSFVQPPPNFLHWSSLSIDVDTFYEKQQANAVTLDDYDVPMKVDSFQDRIGVTIWDAKGNEITLKPALHMTDLEKIYSFFDALKLANGRPLYIEKPQESAFKVMTETEFLSLPTDRVQQLTRLYNMLLTDCNVQSMEFDADGLSTLKRISATIDLQDQSLPCSDDLQSRVRKGTLEMMLEEANSPNGRILNALHFPLPHTGVDWKSSYASDRVAWSSTEGCIMCQSDDPLPASDLYWGLAATKGAMHYLHLDSNGLGTMVLPTCGAKAWFVATSNDPDDHYLADWNLYMDPFDVQSPDHSKWSIEAVYLTPGTRLLMRPNTPHAVFTPENTICYGSHYYSTSGLQDSLFAIVHCFVGNRVLTNTDHLPSRRVLQRMMAYFFEALVRGSIKECETNWNHVPSLKTFTSLMDLLSLCIVIILQNVLDPETYLNSTEHTDDDRTASTQRLAWDLNMMSTSERYRITHARGMAYFMVQWLDINFLVIDAETNEELNISEAIFFPYLARIIVSLQKSKRAAEGEDILGFENCSFKDLHYQISLAFHDKNDVTSALRDCEIEDVRSMAYPDQDTYRIHPRDDERTREYDIDWKLIRITGLTLGDELHQEGHECGWHLEDKHYKFFVEFDQSDENTLWIDEDDGWYKLPVNELADEDEGPARKKKKCD